MAHTITRWQPFADFGDVRSRFDRMLADLADGERGAWAPELDVVEENGDLVVHANIPGMKPDEIKIEVQDDLLTISGEHVEEHEEKDKRYVRRERRVGAFSRTLALPDNAKADEVDATYRDGVLDVVIPLAQPPKHEARTITPKAA